MYLLEFLKLCKHQTRVTTEDSNRNAQHGFYQLIQ